MTAEQGYLVMYYSSLNPNPNQIPMDPTSSVNNPAQFIGGGERALSSWRADAYVSIFNHTIIEFRGHMQPTTLFGPFQMQSDNGRACQGKIENVCTLCWSFLTYGIIKILTRPVNHIENIIDRQ